MIDKAAELTFLGGVFTGITKPTPFLCLAMKLLQLQPELEIAMAFIENSDFKYLRALGALYIRIVAPSADVYKLLEPLLQDSRKLKFMNKDGGKCVTLDVFVFFFFFCVTQP